MKIIITFLIFISCLYSCKQNPKKIDKEYIEKHEIRTLSNKRYYELIDSALIQGNTNAYNLAATTKITSGIGEEFFFYAFIMANKHNNPEAYFHVYLIIIFSSPENPKEALESFDSKTRNFALYYLLKSYEMGYEDAKYSINEIFGKNAPIPKASYYLKEFAKE
jgi:hypothetical protein